MGEGAKAGAKEVEAALPWFVIIRHRLARAGADKLLRCAFATETDAESAALKEQAAAKEQGFGNEGEVEVFEAKDYAEAVRRLVEGGQR